MAMKMKMKMKMKEKSVRNPLRDVSNDIGGRTFLKSRATLQEQIQNCNVPGVDEEDLALDRLLLVHSNLSSLIQQIDEIVAQAFKLKEMSLQGREEIVSFTNVLSEMLSSLKPWVPRFQKVLTRPSQSDNQLTGSLTNNDICAVAEAKNEAIDSPDQNKTEPLISPSPLVSWRANCTIERGRQLFLLTPLPISKALSSKPQIPTKLEFDGYNHSLSFFTGHGDTNDDLLEGLNQTPCKPSDSQLTKVTSTLGHGLPSPQVFPTKYCSMAVVTPCLKMSPPKSCVLLEPISESSQQVAAKPSKSTPFPLGLGQYGAEQFSASSGSDTCDDLTLKYPEILGIQGVNKEGKNKKAVEASPDWVLSPPKTCVLLELCDENSQDIVAIDTHLPRLLNQDTNTIPTKNFIQYFQSKNYQVVPTVESTPMKMENESESFIGAGKRPGENTLKKELWTKFEAASSKQYRFNVCTVKKSARKGFLDLLDEVSSEDETQMQDSR